MAETRKSFGDDVRAPETAKPAASRARKPLFAFSLFSRKQNVSSPRLNREALAALYSHHRCDDGGEVSFAFLLRQCVHALERARDLVAACGAELARAASARGASDAMLAAWAARLFIALFWVFVGVILAREASGGFPVRGLEAASAAMLARIFVALGVLGAVAAFVGGYLVRAGESSFRGKTGFGAEAGAIAREIGENVAAIRDRIGDDGPSAADMSRLHFAGVEAAAFFDSVSFLAEADHARATEKFSAFLDRHAPAPPAGGGAVLLLAGIVIGAVAIILAAAGGWPRFGAAALPLWAILALPGLAFLYATLGAVFAAAGAASAGSAPATARQEILHGLRTAYVEAGAPRADDLIAEIERALSPAQRPQSRHDRSEPAPADSNAGEVAWSRPPEGPRFVPQRFEAAPPIFRPETQASLRKNFFASRERNAEPKQSPGAPDAPPWLKD
jgi:hypothetical protein